MAGSAPYIEKYDGAADTNRLLYPKLFMQWSKRGLSPRAASALALAGCDTVEQVTALGRQWFQEKPNVGVKTLNELARLAGWSDEPMTPAAAVATALQLSIPDPEAAQEAALDCLISLRRAGYVIASRQSAPAGRR